VKRPQVLLLLLLVPAALPAQSDPLAWLNSVRQRAGASPVSADALLSRTASLWAARLAEAGLLTHRGDDGSTGLDRYRAQGGTEARVGEILGAGPDLVHVEKGWMASAEHRQLVQSRGWTHAGWGSAVSGSSLVTVMMFTEKRVADLEIIHDLTDLSVSGRFVPRDAAGCVLYNGLEQVPPAWWDPATRSFRFDVSDTALAGYLRLGFTDAAGRFTLTNAFTWPPGTGSPGAEDRFSSPAPSP
jgi:hypothetical protein